MIFKRFQLQASLASDEGLVYDRIVEHGRWHVLHERVFSFEGRFYMISYRVGATEDQPYDPFEDEPEAMEVPEVFPKVITSVSFRRK